MINASISFVSQHPSLFSGTIKDNITMWNSKISEKDIIAAAKDACILDCILERREQFDSIVAESGVNFSGGQKMRLEIARALATNPSVLILDEATSALDVATEQKIMENIKRRGCTCLIIAQRLSAVRNCDSIVVIENGSIVQHGTHSELAASDGAYRLLFCNGRNKVKI